MLKGKTALVTGSTSGIGLGVALSLARDGAHIMLNGFGEYESAKRAVAECGVKVSYHGADMSKPAEIEAMVRACEQEFGALDILVNNAGIQHVAKVEDFPPERWDAIIAINLTSAFHTTRLALPGMKKRNWGRILNVASVHGLVASAEKSAYVASKHGIVGFTKSHRARNRDHWHHGQRHLPGLGADAAGAKAGRRARRAGRRRAMPRPRSSCWPRSSRRCSSRRPSSSARSRCSCVRRPATTCAAWPGTSTAAGSRSSGAGLRELA